MPPSSSLAPCSRALSFPIFTPKRLRLRKPRAAAAQRATLLCESNTKKKPRHARSRHHGWQLRRGKPPRSSSELRQRRMPAPICPTHLPRSSTINNGAILCRRHQRWHCQRQCQTSLAHAPSAEAESRRPLRQRPLSTGGPPPRAVLLLAFWEVLRRSVRFSLMLLHRRRPPFLPLLPLITGGQP